MPECIDKRSSIPTWLVLNSGTLCAGDGVTYSNSCYATHIGGVTSFEEGECGSDPCIDENLIDPNVPMSCHLGPMCGCDGPYSNSCEAFCGKTTYTQGECGPTACVTW